MSEFIFPTTYTAPDGSEKRIPHPSRPIKEGWVANTLVVGFGSGHSQRRPKGRPIRQWELEYKALNQAQKDALEAFWFRVYGSAYSFAWAHPISGHVYKVRFSDDAVSVENFAHPAVSGPLYTMAFKIQEEL